MKKKKFYTGLTLAILAANTLLPVMVQATDDSSVTVTENQINSYNDFFTAQADNSITTQAADILYQPEDIVTIIVQLAEEPVLSEDNNVEDYQDVQEFLDSSEAQEQEEQILATQEEVLDDLEEKTAGEFAVNYQYALLMNGFSVTTAYQNLATIQEDAAVRTAYVAEEYTAPEPESETDLTTAATNSFVPSSYTGAGTVITVIDTGLDTSHPAFQTTPAQASKNSNDIQTILNTKNLNAEAATPNLSAGQVVVNQKVIFAYDYYDQDTNVAPSAATANAAAHGTHVAGIAAGHDTTSGANFSGTAPDAQLQILKVFDDGNTKSSEALIFAALEDAVALGTDVINLSLGTPVGTSTATTDTTSALYQNIERAGITLVASIGNNYSSYYHSTTGTNLAPAENPDSGSISQPASYLQTLAVASGNSNLLTNYSSSQSSVNGNLSDFSSWGVTPDLKLKPEITGIGQNVTSSVPTATGRDYNTMTGTSMSSPQIAGMAALVKEALKQKLPNLSLLQQKQYTDNLLMSTATPIVDSSNRSLYYSPRKQGSGLVNGAQATQLQAFLSTGTNEKPQINSGDDPQKRGVYQLSFTITNISNQTQSYQLSGVGQTPAVTNQNGKNYQAQNDQALSGNFSGLTTVSVPANSSRQVTVTYTLSNADKNFLNTNFVNGSFVEGYLFLTGTSANTANLSLPFLGFYGDWNAQSILDPAGLNSTNYQMTESTLYTSFNDTRYRLGTNIYQTTAQNLSTNHFTISPNNDGLADEVSQLSISQLRSSAGATLNVRNAATTVFTKNIDEVWKKTYYNGRQMVMESINDLKWAGTNNASQTLSDGDYTFNYGLKNIYQNGIDHTTSNTLSFTLTVDTTAPTLSNSKLVTENGQTFLTATVTDANSLMQVQAAPVTTAGETQTADWQNIFSATAYPDTTKSAEIKLNVTNLTTDKIAVAVIDQGSNEATYTLAIDGRDFSQLQNSITEANHLFNSGEINQYSVVSAATLLNAVTDGETMLKNQSGAQTDIDALVARITQALATLQTAEVPNGAILYRLYNPNSGEHLYTAGKAERDNLIPLGWQAEGLAWRTPTEGATIYRLYNPNSGEHLYTIGVSENEFLSSIGWIAEGRAFFAATAETGIPIYRLFNPNTDGPGSHHYTTSNNERFSLTPLGWQDENIAFYGLN